MSDNLKKLFLYTSAAIGWIAAVGFIGTEISVGIDPEVVKNFLGDAASNEITQAGFFFTMAAWLHSGRVKKEIKSNFVSLTSAINNVAESLRADLENHSTKLESHAILLDSMGNRLHHVENKLNLKPGA